MPSQRALQGLGSSCSFSLPVTTPVVNSCFVLCLMQGCWLQDSSIGLTNGTACFLTPTSRPPRRASAPYQQKARIGLRSLPERGRAPLGCSQDTRRPQPSQTRGLPSPYSRGFRQRSRTPCSLVPLLCHFSRSLKPLPLPLQSTAATRLPCTTHKPIIQQVRKRILKVIYIYICALVTVLRRVCFREN